MVTKPSGNKVNQIILQKNLNRSILLANLLGRGLHANGKNLWLEQSNFR